MSSKAGIRELAMALVRKHDITQKDAERFVTLMFDTLNEGLETDKLVKLKGLGTFKVTNVSARKSIDVNTGEPIVIESRDKISFTPDNTMRDLVNRPFSQFETVVVNEGVDLEMLENVSTTPSSEEEPNDLSEPEMPSTHEETEPILIAEDVPTTIETPVEEPTEQPQGTLSLAWRTRTCSYRDDPFCGFKRRNTGRNRRSILISPFHPSTFNAQCR